MLKKISAKLRDWIEEKHYGSVSGMLLEHGLFLLAAAVAALLASMVLPVLLEGA